MVHSLCFNSFYVDTLWICKREEVKRVCVPAEGSSSAGGYTVGAPYVGGGHVKGAYAGGDGLYERYSGDNRGSYGSSAYRDYGHAVHMVEVYMEDIVKAVVEDILQVLVLVDVHTQEMMVHVVE